VFDFKFELERHGWAHSCFEWDGGSTEFRTSYLTDPISELAELARWIVDPVYRRIARWPSKALFSDEPGELVLDLQWKELLTEKEIQNRVNVQERVLILSLAEWDDMAIPGGAPNKVHTVQEIRASDFVEIVFRELGELWSKYGVIDYRERWHDFDFPLPHFAAIGQCLKHPIPSRALWINAKPNSK
jgi:hypothetical protein